MTIKSAKEQLQKQQSRFEELSHSLYESEKNMEDYKNEMVEQIRINTEAKGDKSKRQSMLEQFEQRQKQILSEKEYLADQIHTQEVHMQVLLKQQKEFEEQQQELNMLHLEQKSRIAARTAKYSSRAKTERTTIIAKAFSFFCSF